MSSSMKCNTEHTSNQSLELLLQTEQYAIKLI